MRTKDEDLTDAIYALNGAYYYMDCVADVANLVHGSKEKTEKIMQSINLLRNEFEALKKSEKRILF